MSTYTTKKCPHCRKAYEHYSTATKKYENHIGSPFITCMYCGEVFIDKDMKEPALEPFEDKTPNLFSFLLGFLYPFGLAAVLFTIIFFCMDEYSSGILIITLALYAIYFLLVVSGYKKRYSIQDDLRKDYQESLDRLNDVEYAKALKDIGYKVPEKYLKPHEDELNISPLYMDHTDTIDSTDDKCTYIELRTQCNKTEQIVEMMPNAKYCRKCGAKLMENAIFCHCCGTKVHSEDTL